MRIAGLIDAAVQKRLASEKLASAPLADDAEFLRRAYLDIAGVIPSADKANAFLESKDPNKRAKLIDELLAAPEYARRMTDIWKALLIPNTPAAARQKHEPMVQWLESAFASNKPFNAFARDLITATGMQDENGAVTFYLTHESVDQMTDRVAKVFLGVQIQCAQCHDHPFVDWKQTEYWGMAAFFTRVKSAYVKEGNLQRYGAKEDTAPKSKPLLMVPPSLKSVPPTFLRGAQPKVAADGPLLPTLADWVAAKDNPYLARAAVNRLWQQFFGSGLVNPVDDMTESNEPSHPELLTALAREFADSNFNLKVLIRAICTSRTYQQTSRPAEGAGDNKALFSRMAIKVLSPHQLGDSLDAVFALAGGKPEPVTEQSRKLKMGERNRFAAIFMGEEDADPTEYQAGIPQALHLMNSKHHYRIAKAANEVLAQKQTPDKVVETLFLATLSRRPSADEAKAMTAHFAKSPDKRTAAGDVLWALINSTEFISNH